MGFVPCSLLSGLDPGSATQGPQPSGLSYILVLTHWSPGPSLVQECLGFLFMTLSCPKPWRPVQWDESKRHNGFCYSYEWFLYLF